MQVTVQLNLKDTIAPADLLAWLSLGQMLDSGQAFSEKPSAAETADLQETFAAKAQESYAELQANTEHDNRAANSTINTPATTPTPAPVSEPQARRKQGRPRKAAAAATPVQPAAPAGFEPPPGIVYQPPPAAIAPPLAEPLQQAYPPGAYPPGISTPPPPQPAVAMPPASSPPAYVNGAEMRLEDFKAEAFNIQTAAAERGLQSAYPFNMARSNTWPDGSPKPFSTMQMDSVPPDQRRKLLDACLSLLTA